MACFLVPAAEAVVVTAARSIARSKEKKHELPKYQAEEDTADIEETTETSKIPFSRKLKWLSNLSWGGTALLIFEHVWHGEVVPWFPFLTAVGNSADTAGMLHEMATAGVAMAAVVTAVWGGMLAIVRFMEKRMSRDAVAAAEVNGK